MIMPPVTLSDKSFSWDDPRAKGGSMTSKLSLFLLLFLLSPLARAFLPHHAYTFDFNIRTEQEITWEQEQKILRALDIIRQVIMMPEFRDQILKHRFQGKRGFQYDQGLSNHQIYQRILEGAERLQPFKNNRMDLLLEFYTDYDSNVIGYTLPSTMKVWINNKYFETNSDAQVAANLIHEWLHKLGFHHDRERTVERRSSVPYAVGRIVRELGEEFP